MFLAALASMLTLTVAISWYSGVEEPKEPIANDSFRDEEVRSAGGMSFCVYVMIVGLASIGSKGHVLI